MTNQLDRLEALRERLMNERVTWNGTPEDARTEYMLGRVDLANELLALLPESDAEPVRRP